MEILKTNVIHGSRWSSRIEVGGAECGKVDSVLYWPDVAKREAGVDLRQNSQVPQGIVFQSIPIGPHIRNHQWQYVI
jgi:hypothetical protein